MAFPAGVMLPGLLAPLQAFFSVAAAPPEHPTGEDEGLEAQAIDPDLGLKLDVNEDDKYLPS